MLVAGRYRSQQQLIGPVFFPIYLFALQAGLGAALLVTVCALGRDSGRAGRSDPTLARGDARVPGPGA